MNMQDRWIGVFDSGMGGISVLQALRRELPGERFLFFGDSAYAPYGTKTPQEVLQRVDAVVQALEQEQIKALVIACNTATAVAAAALRAEKPYPIIGMEPALKPAHEHRHGGNILVLATPVTLALPKFQSLYAQYGEGAVPVPCPGLMELVEAEDWTAARQYLQRLLAEAPTPLDAVVLGCTHYVFLRPLLRELLPPETELLDGNTGTARQLRRVLEARQLLRDQGEGCILLKTSGAAEVVPLMERFLTFPTD